MALPNAIFQMPGARSCDRQVTLVCSRRPGHKYACPMPRQGTCGGCRPPFLVLPFLWSPARRGDEPVHLEHLRTSHPALAASASHVALLEAFNHPSKPPSPPFSWLLAGRAKGPFSHGQVCSCCPAPREPSENSHYSTISSAMQSAMQCLENRWTREYHSDCRLFIIP